MQSGALRGDSPMVNEAKVKYFLALAGCLNFSKAANQLYISQQALSAQISALESDLGVTLFHRTTRSVSLTTAGYAFYELMLPLSKQYRVFLDAYSSREDRKNLRIACLEDMNLTQALTSAKDSLLKQGSTVQLRFIFKTTYQEILKGLDTEEYDLAIMPNATIPDDNQYVTKIVSTSVSYFFFSKRLPNSSKITSLEDAKDAVFFVGPKDNPARKKISDDCAELGFQPNFFEPGTTPAIERMMIEAGEGIGFGDKHSLLYQNKALTHIEYKRPANVLAVWKKQRTNQTIVSFAKAMALNMA